MLEETLVNAIVGGSLIGLAAALLFLSIGRIAGISGIAAAALRRAARNYWAWGFLLGLMAGGVALHRLLGIVPVQDLAGIELLPLLAGGVLVGFGTRLGSGCTSGHGVCGLARFSPRSAAATVTFLLVGMIVATTSAGIWR